MTSLARMLLFGASIFLTSVQGAVASNMVALILPLSGPMADSHTVHSFILRPDARQALGLHDIDILILGAWNCEINIQQTRRAIDVDGAFAIVSRGCSSDNVLHAVSSKVLFLDVGGVSPERQPLDSYLSFDEDALFLQLGYDEEAWKQPLDVLRSLGVSSSDFNQWIQPPIACSSQLSSTFRSTPGSYCYLDNKTKDAIRIVSQFTDPDYPATDYDFLVIAALQVVAAIYRDPNLYFDSEPFRVSTVIGDLSYGPSRSILLPLQYRIDLDAAESRGMHSTLDGLLATFCPGCAGSTKMCGSRCPDDCNNNCKKEGDKQCCNKSGMPAPR